MRARSQPLDAPARDASQAPAARKSKRARGGSGAAPPAQPDGKGQHGGARPGAGHPLTTIDPGAVERAAQLGATIEEIAAFLGVGRSTLRDRVTETSPTYDPAVADALERGRLNGRMTLRRLQWQAAAKGDRTMLVWLGKQMLGQTDKVETSGSLNLKRDASELSDDELAAIIRGDAGPGGG